MGWLSERPGLNTSLPLPLQKLSQSHLSSSQTLKPTLQLPSSLSAPAFPQVAPIPNLPYPRPARPARVTLHHSSPQPPLSFAAPVCLTTSELSCPLTSLSCSLALTPQSPEGTSLLLNPGSTSPPNLSCPLTALDLMALSSQLQRLGLPSYLFSLHQCFPWSSGISEAQSPGLCPFFLSLGDLSSPSRSQVPPTANNSQVSLISSPSACHVCGPDLLEHLPGWQGLPSVFPLASPTQHGHEGHKQPEATSPHFPNRLERPPSAQSPQGDAGLLSLPHPSASFLQLGSHQVSVPSAP